MNYKWNFGDGDSSNSLSPIKMYQTELAATYNVYLAVKNMVGCTDTISVPVNIKETKDSYQLEVVAPAMEKADFKINIENNLLTISAEKKTENKVENEKQIRKEYTHRAFSRTFTLDDVINTADISAKYDNGILHLTLPKKEEVKVVPKEIS